MFKVQHRKEQTPTRPRPEFNAPISQPKQQQHTAAQIEGLTLDGLRATAKQEQLRIPNTVTVGHVAW